MSVGVFYFSLATAKSGVIRCLKRFCYSHARVRYTYALRAIVDNEQWPFNYTFRQAFGHTYYVVLGKKFTVISSRRMRGKLRGNS